MHQCQMGFQSSVYSSYRNWTIGFIVPYWSQTLKEVAVSLQQIVRRIKDRACACSYTSGF